MKSTFPPQSTVFISRAGRLVVLFVGILVAFGLNPHLRADGCSGHFTLTRQADVDAFDCDSVGGDLVIASGSVDPIQNLDALVGLTSVGEDLVINGNTQLTRIDGLAGVRSVAGVLAIQGNPVLENLDGLASLESVGAFAIVQGNPLLANLGGLSSLSSVGEFLFISGNSSLMEYCGLHRLLDGRGLNGALLIMANAVNPTAAEILAAGACAGDPDSDGDGIVDALDACPNSRGLGETVVVGGRDTGVVNHLFEGGCTLNDLVDELEQGAGNHGEFVSGVTELREALREEGVISNRESGAIQAAAARSKRR